MTFAQFIGGGSTGVIGLINTIIVPVILALAFLAFVFGAVKYYFIGGREESGRAVARQFMLWGILGLVVLFSVWGLVNILLSTLGIAP